MHLVLQVAVTFTSSDVVYIMSADGAGSYAQYYYQTDPFNGFFGGNGWRAAGDVNTDRSNVIVAPDDGLIVNRISSGDVSVVVSGTVNAIDHTRTLPNGFSLVAYPFPVDTTLDDSGIYAADNGYTSGGDVSQSDVVFVLASDGSYTQYYRQTDPFNGFFGGDGWRIAGDVNTDVGSTVIPAGSAVDYPAQRFWLDLGGLSTIHSLIPFNYLLIFIYIKS